MRILIFALLGIAGLFAAWDTMLHAIGFIEAGSCELPFLLWPCFDDRSVYDAFWMAIHAFILFAIALAIGGRRYRD